MTTSKFAAQLTAQIGEEFAAHHQYLAIAAHYESMTLPQLAGFFYRQAAEERGHAMMMVQYLLDTDQPVRIPPPRPRPATSTAWSRPSSSPSPRKRGSPSRSTS